MSIACLESPLAALLPREEAAAYIGFSVAALAAWRTAESIATFSPSPRSASGPITARPISTALSNRVLIVRHDRKHILRVFRHGRRAGATDGRMNPTCPTLTRQAATIPKPWRRSTLTHRCPVCRRVGCLFTGPHDAPVAAICRRVEASRRIGERGWLHVLNDSGPTWAPWRVSLAKLAGGPR